MKICLSDAEISYSSSLVLPNSTSRVMLTTLLIVDISVLSLALLLNFVDILA